MPWIEKERLEAARSIDLLTYLQEREPYELVRSAPNEYRTKTHGSLVISNNKWYWNRGQFGGASALDYLIKIRGVSLAEAVETIEAGGDVSVVADYVKRELAREQVFILNELLINMTTINVNGINVTYSFALPSS